MPLVFLISVFVLAACSAKQNETEVNYKELETIFAANKKTDLCYWHYDGLESNRNKEYYYFIYSCAPSKDYKGSTVLVKERLKVRKSILNVTGVNSNGGEVNMNNLKKR